MAVHMRNGIQYGGIPNGTVKGVNPSTVPTTVKQLNQIGTVGNIAPVTIPSAVKFSNGDTLETAIGSVATIETSPAVAAHDAGEYIFYNGQMYKVIAAIAVGETLTVDTNIEATSVGAELTSLNNGLTTKTTGTITTNRSNVTISKNGCIRCADVVIASAMLTGTTQATGIFFNVPSGFRPNQTIAIPVFFTINGVEHTELGTIGTDGTVSVVYSSSQQVSRIFFSVCYHV